MTLRLTVAMVLAILIVAESVLDVISTKAAMKKGAYEANPLMAWLQQQLGSYWAWVRVGAAAILATCVAAFLPAPYSLISLFTLACVYAAIVKNNFDLANDEA